MPSESDFIFDTDSGRPLHRRDVEALFRNGYIDHAQYLDGLRLAGVRPEWQGWMDRLLLVAGTCLLLAGVIFFFAWNWQDMHKFLKLGVVEAAISLLVLGALFKNSDSRAGRALLVAAGVLVGVFFAVFGQIYQTGADIWEMFRAWTLLLLPWAIAGRSAAVWLLVACLANLWGVLWWDQQGQGLIAQEWMYFLMSSLGLVAYWIMEILGRRLTDYGRWRGWQYCFLILALGWINAAGWHAVISGDIATGIGAGVLLAAAWIVPVRRRDPAALVLCLLSLWSYCVALGFRLMMASGMDSEGFSLVGMISLTIPVVGVVQIRKYTRGYR